MVIPKDEVRDFARFLSTEFQSKPMLRSGEDGELLRAIVGNQLLIVLDLDHSAADVWCSDEDSMREIWSAWRGYQQPV